MNKIILVVFFVGAALAQPPNYSNYQSAGQNYQFGAAGFRANVASLESDRSSYGSAYSSQYGRQGTTRNTESEPARYAFKYDINDQVELGHQEQRDGDNTSGTYYVVLPDGRRQIVQYRVDSDGYHPVISYQDAPSGRAGNVQNYQTENNYQTGSYSQSGRNAQNRY